MELSLYIQYNFWGPTYLPKLLLCHFYMQNSKDVKGQIISKGLFGVLKFSQKTNERIRRSSKKEFVCLFLWGNLRIPNVVSKLSDLYVSELRNILRTS